MLAGVRVLGEDGNRSYPEIADGGITMPRLISALASSAARPLSACLLAVTTTRSGAPLTSSRRLARERVVGLLE